MGGDAPSEILPSATTPPRSYSHPDLTLVSSSSFIQVDSGAESVNGTVTLFLSVWDDLDDHPRRGPGRLP
jgi:hypothetical protein